MNEASNQRPGGTEREIFLKALDFPEGVERQGYLDRACGGDGQLRRRVEELLQAHQQAGDFMHHPAPQRPAEPASERAGTIIGRYKLLEQIGEGGFGTVWMAEQEEPVRRRVALKVIKLGMDTKEVVARFEAERQALALMDHPNIARVFDGGATEAGRPYFVMELVRGVPITEYCDAHQLSTRERLELFLQVCQAVQHAQQKGIVHRDLKPSNILVAVQDNRALPKVIDFGVAKATQSRLTTKTLFTRFHQFMGTPAYMSPEQAGLGGLDVDTRSDIYALGVLLYELLTGRTPFDTQRLLEAGYDVMLRTIREEEPPKPSTRLTTLTAEQLDVVAARRDVEPGRLGRLVRGDLDWIVMKCLEKDRTRRYETANGLAMDIQRHLSNEPVLASPPSPAYRLSKLARRHRLAVAVAGIVVLALAAGLSAALLGLARARHAEAIARQNLYAATINLAQHTFQEGDIKRTHDLLESARPRPGERDLRGFEWHYLRRLLRGEKLQLNVQGEVRAVAYAPDGKTLATGGTDGVLALWDAATGRQTRSIAVCRGTVHSVAFSPNGEFIASAGDDQSVKIWSAQDGAEVAKLTGQRDKVACLAWSPDGQLLAGATGHPGTGSGLAIQRFVGDLRDPQILVWNRATGERIANLSGHQNSIMSLAFSPDGATLASASADGTVKLWDVHASQLRRSLERHHGPVYGVAFAPDGNTLASVGHDATVILWDPRDGAFRSSLHGHAGPVFCVAFSPDGHTLATGGYDHTARVWDAESGDPVTTLRGHARYVWALAFSPDGQTLATAAWDGKVNLWDLAKPVDFATFQGTSLPADNGAHSLAFSPDGKVLASGSSVVKLWDPIRREEAAQMPNSHSMNALVAFSPDGKLLVGSNVGELNGWNPETQETVFAFHAHDHRIWDLKFSPDGRLLATGDSAGDIKLWDVATHTLLHTFPQLMSFIRSLAFSPDGKTLAVLGRTITPNRQAIHFWDTRARTLRAELPLEGVGAWIVYSPDGKYFATSEYTPAHRVIALRDAQTGQVLRRLSGHSDIIYSGAFSPDSTRLASAAWDGTVRLWDVATGLELLTFQGHTKGVMYSVAFSPDGRQLVAGTGRDVTGDKIVLWSASPTQDQ